MDKKKKGIAIAAFGVLIALALSFTTFKMLDGGKEAKRFIYHDKTGAMTLHENQEEARYTQLQAYMEAQEKAEKSKTDTKKTTESTANSTSSSGSTSSSSGSQSSSSSSGSVSGGSGSSGGSTSSSGGSSSGSTGSSSGSGTPAPKPAHTHSYGGWNVDQGSGTKTRYCSCGASETVAATKVIDQAYQPGYYKTEYREEPNWVETWYWVDDNGVVHTVYSEEEAYSIYLSGKAASWGTGEDEQQGTISVPYEVWVPEVPEKYHWE